MKSRNIITLILLISIQVLAQNIAIGQWRDHLAYNFATDVAIAENKVYCIANENLFYYDTQSEEVVRQSKPQGFSDINAIAIDYENVSKTLFIGYKNSNIDLIKDGRIINMPQILRKQMIGNKTINNVKFFNGLAYVSTGFGIVVIDVIKEEVKDTYGIDTLSQNVNEIAFDSEYIYAATNNGIFKALQSDKFLSNYKAWSKITSYFPTKKITSIAVFNDSLVANFNENNKNNFQIYSKGLDSWQIYRPDFPYIFESFTETSLGLFVAYDGAMILCGPNRKFIEIVGNYNNANPSKCVVDKNGNYWIADKRNGLIKKVSNAESYFFYKPNGPFDNNSVQLKSSGNSIWVAPGGAPGGNNSYMRTNLSIFKNNEWKYIAEESFRKAAGAYEYWDAMHVAPNPYNENLGFMGSFGRGVAEIRNDSVITIYKEGNSTIKYAICCEFARIGGLDYDKEENLWVANYEQPNYLLVRKADTKWLSFELRGFNSPQIQSLTVSKSQKIWMVSEKGGLIGFDYGATIDDMTDDIEKIIGFEQGNGGIPGTSTICATEDLNGEMWIGSDKGISVLHSPDNIFSGTKQDAQQIKIEQDGYVGYLLESDKVNCITVDDANRKWIGTERSGVFCVSHDGTKQLEHFTTDNSPLLSNNIFSIAIINKTGEIFFSTDKGIISYKATATTGFFEACDSVLAYPNPVKPNYTGVIAIRGLIENSNVKITDVAGNLVYQTTTIGGQAIWNGKNFAGDVAQPGVYYIMSSSADGTAGCNSKVVLMR